MSDVTEPANGSVRFTVKELVVNLEARVRKLETRVAAMYVVIPILTATGTALIVKAIVG